MIMEMPETESTATKRQVWNAGRTVGAKRALKPKQIWEIRFYLNQRRRLRDRALFDLAIDSKLRGCDLVQMKIGDLVSGGQIRTRAIVMQQKTGRPVQFELLPDARASLLTWLERRGGTVDDYVFPSRVDHNGHLSTRQYARLVDEWVTGVGLMRSDYGRTHFAERRQRSSTGRPATFVPSRSFSVIARLRTQCATSGSTWKMRSPLPRTLKFDLIGSSFPASGRFTVLLGHLRLSSHEQRTAAPAGIGHCGRDRRVPVYGEGWWSPDGRLLSHDV
jgi:hypothetical protein